MTGPLTGGCACGKVRYRISGEPFGAGWCHCTICRRTSGAPAMAFASVAARDFALECDPDVLTVYRSSA